MKFDWILFLGISIIGPYLGCKMCAALEKKMTGEVRMEIKYRKKRLRSNLISIAVSYIVTVQIIGLINGNAYQDLDLWIRALSIGIGISIYLCLQGIIYRISILN